MNLFKIVQRDQTEGEKEKADERDRKKRRSNKSKREKFWPERKALSFEVLSSPSERVEPLKHTHIHTNATSGILLSKGRRLSVTQRGVKEQREGGKKNFEDIEKV